jgi:hypothetical protein
MDSENIQRVIVFEKSLDRRARNERDDACCDPDKNSSARFDESAGRGDADKSRDDSGAEPENARLSDPWAISGAVVTIFSTCSSRLSAKTVIFRPFRIL